MKDTTSTPTAPRRKPEKMLLGRRVRAEYRPVALPAHQGNPLIEALPARRTEREVCDMVRGKIPEYDEDVRQLDPTVRRDYLSTLPRVFVTLPRHMRVEEAVMDGIRNSYSYRNPMQPGYMLDQVERAEAIDFDSQDYDEPMIGASSLIGPAGTGKTRILKRCLVRGCPQLIEHYDYQGKKLAIRQIAWIYISCAHDGSAKSLCEDIARAMDTILGDTDYERRVRREKTEHDKQVELARALALHVVGLIVIDEFQNICVGRHVERKRLARFLVGIMENMSTRVMLAGTPEAQSEVVKDGPLMRRTIGETGQIGWDRITDAEEWIRFLHGVWRYQYTATATPLSEGKGSLADTIHSLSHGIPDIAVKLYRMAQYEVIGNMADPREALTVEVFESVSKTRMELARTLLINPDGTPRSTIDWDKPNNQQQLRGNEADPEESATSTSAG